MTGMIVTVIIAVSVIYGALSGNMSELTEAVLNEPVNAVELAIYLCGGMCFWCGLMRIADKAGVTGLISRFMKIPLSAVFRNIDRNGKAFSAICMNITANMLGLGNAATPLGIEAVKALAEEERNGDTAGDSMIKFTVLNTASVTLIPSTAASLRLKYGSDDPMEIILPVIITSALSLAAALAVAEAGCIKDRRSSESNDSLYYPYNNSDSSYCRNIQKN